MTRCDRCDAWGASFPAQLDGGALLYCAPCARELGLARRCKLCGRTCSVRYLAFGACQDCAHRAIREEQHPGREALIFAAGCVGTLLAIVCLLAAIDWLLR